MSTHVHVHVLLTVYLQSIIFCILYVWRFFIIILNAVPCAIYFLQELIDDGSLRYETLNPWVKYLRTMKSVSFYLYSVQFNYKFLYTFLTIENKFKSSQSFRVHSLQPLTLICTSRILWKISPHISNWSYRLYCTQSNYAQIFQQGTEEQAHLT